MTPKKCAGQLYAATVRPTMNGWEHWGRRDWVAFYATEFAGAMKFAEIAALEWAAKTAERLSETTHWDDPSAGIVAEIRSEIERKKGGGE